jgi:hypothetical protein
MKARPLAETSEPAFELAFRIRHPSMDPAELTRELKLEPTHTFRAGQPRETRGTRLPASVHTESYWLATLDLAAWTSGMWPPADMGKDSDLAKPLRSPAWIDLGMALAMTARVLVRSHAALFEKVRAEGGEVCLLISISPGATSSFSLAASVCQVFGDLGINIEFEFAEE